MAEYRLNELRKLELFQGIKPETAEMLFKQGKFVSYPKGTLLFRAKEASPSIFVQVTGKSMIYNLTHHGKRKIIYILGSGILLNHHVSDTETSCVYCETLDKCTVFTIAKSDFVKAMQMDFDLAMKVFTTQEKKIWRLTHQLKNTMSSIYLERKLAAKLWKLSRDFGIPKGKGVEIDVNLSITFLADMLGVPRETTSRICSTLIEYGLIKIYKKRIFIPQPEKLSYFYRHGKFVQNK